jgi:release factor glutamine methyltransferase
MRVRDREPFPELIDRPGGMPPEINALVADARRRFRAAGIQQDEAALDARLLAQHVLGWDGTRLLTHGDEPAPPELLRDLEPLVQRRIAREPLAYIIGCREFWNLAIEVTPAVLVPRPETELLIEIALDRLDHRQPIRLLDLCTGSGCLAVALAREFPRATVVASDVSADALAVAKRNIARYGLAARVQCVCADLFAGVAGPFDLIVSNPPYVPIRDASQLQQEVRKYEPPVALFGGFDGLQVVRRILTEAPAMLADEGTLIFEFGAGQDSAIAETIERIPSLTLTAIERDLQDIPRAAVVTRTRPRPSHERPPSRT